MAAGKRAHRRTLTTAVVAALGALSLGFTTAPAQEAQQQASSGWIVVLHDGELSTATDSARTVRGHGARIETTYRTALNGYAVQATSTQAAKLAADPAVRAVVPDTQVRAHAVQDNAPWHLDRLDDGNGPSDGSYEYPDSAGEGVTAYVLDTGVRITHQEFGGRASYGYDAVGDGDQAPDDNGHGTHVAGIIAGEEYGVAKKAEVKAVRVLDGNGAGTVSDVIEGIDWVTANAQKPAVAVMSLGGSANQALDEAVRNSIASGVTYSVAAGGSAADAGNFSPARVEEALTVSSTGTDDNRAGFANYGSVVDLFAPGVDITAAWNTSDTALNTLSGTSSSAAIVAGLVAVELGETGDNAPAAVAEALKSYAAKDAVGSPGTGTPNLLAQVRPVG
ncbi:S8 family peptidase [Streptomyces sp. XM4193]|uniref:S8 family peptidase n=1 Tax=Streptomyces sp. XM4193 TaxID=2929782 RepID=UPI001FFA7ED9|nr:S8 family peptidase [Streptomyces sp. XM4193]MCK1795934.1 S8 family peptidase [Streptomyces sp. XM4193]